MVTLQKPPVMLITHSILAQAFTTDIGAQALQVVELLLTPWGFIISATAATAVTGALFSRFGTELLGAFVIFLLSMMRSESKYADNTLIGPLEILRAYSRPVAFALMLILALRMIPVNRGNRRMLFVFPIGFLLAYELYYLMMLGLFVDPARSIFGALAVVSVALTVCFGYAKWSQPFDTRPGLIRMFAIAGMCFILVNVTQLFLGYSNAILGGRLAGVSGNAQQLAATCCVFEIIACYYFSASRAGTITRWLAAAAMGTLGLFVLWSGSRTGVICSAVVLITFFRAKVGRLAILTVVGALVFLSLTAVFEESTSLTDRLFYGSDTRSRVWAIAIEEFFRAPIFGSIPSAQEDTLNLAESTYLRSLALLGAMGGMFVFLLVASMAWTAVRVWRASLRYPALTPHADIVISATAFMIVVNAAEGLMMGVLTLFVVFLYFTFAMAAYVLDPANQVDPDQIEGQEFGTESV